MKNNVTLQVRIPKQKAISILGRLYGSGCLSREQYERMVGKIDLEVLLKEEKKRLKMDKILSKVLKKGKKRTK